MKRSIDLKVSSYVRVNGEWTNTNDLTPEQKVALATWIKQTLLNVRYRGVATFDVVKKDSPDQE